MKTLLIGIHGRQESGKDVIAKYLKEYLETVLKPTVIDRFAANIYAMATQVDPVFRPDMTHLEKSDYVLGLEHLGTRRNFLEKLGTEFGRQLIHPLLWTNTTMGRADVMAVNGVSTILADVRTKDEQAAILSRNGVILHLEPDWVQTGQLSTHPFTATKLEVMNPRRETTLVLKWGHLDDARDSAIACVDSWCAKGLGLYMGGGAD